MASSRSAASARDLRGEDSGDGAVAFVVLIVGAIVVGLALFVEASYAPPLWLHALLWGPTIPFLTILFMRPLKATLIALQYRHKSGEAGPTL